MAHSPLLTLARDSILEVLQAENRINKNTLLQKYELLAQKVATQVTIYIDNEVFSFSTSLENNNSLVDDVVANAKSAAFLQKNILTSSQYLHCQIEVALLTFEQIKHTFDEKVFLTYLNSQTNGILLFQEESEENYFHIPSHIHENNLEDFLGNKALNLKYYMTYSLEKAKDSAIIK